MDPCLIFSFRNLSFAVRGRLQSFVLPSASLSILHRVLYCRPCLHLSIRPLYELIARKRTAEDYHRIAEENGWVAEAHEEEDSKKQTKDELSDRYKKCYEMAAFRLRFVGSYH
jgi:hypothetical protein